MDSQSEHKKKKKKRKLGSEENNADVGGHAGRKEKKKKSKKHNKETDQSEGEGHTGGGPSTDNDGGDTCAAPPPSKYVPGGDFERLSSSFLDASELNDDTEVWLLQVPYQLMPLRHLADYEWHMEKLREIEPDRIAILRDAEGADQFSVLAYDNGEESDAVVLNAEDGGTVRTLPVTMCGRIIPQLLVANEETKDTDQQQNQRNPDDGGSQVMTVTGQEGKEKRKEKVQRGKEEGEGGKEYRKNGKKKIRGDKEKKKKHRVKKLPLEGEKAT